MNFVWVFILILGLHAGLGLGVPIIAAAGPMGDNFLIANHNGDNIVYMNGDTGSIKLFVAPGSGGLISPDTMLFHPYTGRLLVASGTNESNPAILMFDQYSGKFIGRFDDGMLGFLGSKSWKLPQVLAHVDHSELVEASSNSSPFSPNPTFAVLSVISHLPAHSPFHILQFTSLANL